MGDRFPRFLAAAVQAAPVFLDREATTAKACRLIAEAAANGARLIVFPEVFIPAYPYWSWVGTPIEGMPFFTELYQGAVDVPGPTVATLSEAVARAAAYVVIGVNERDASRPGTMWNTNLIFGKDGQLLGKHRKIVPTFAEKLTWGFGDGSSLRVYETELGRLGTLACGENTNTLARWALLAQGEQIHTSNYPAFPAASGNDVDRTISIRAIAHAYEGKVFNVVSCGAMSDEILARVGTAEQRRRFLETSRAISGIVGPNGDWVSDPLVDREGIVYGEINLELTVYFKQWHDLLGAYNRFDIFQFYLNRRPNLPIRIVGDEEGPAMPAAPTLEEVVALSALG